MIRYGTGKAGQFAKGVADRHFQAMYIRTMFVVYVIGTFAGIMLGFSLLPAVFRFVPVARRLPQITYWVMIGMAAVAATLTAWWLYGRHARVLDQLARQRVAALHGGQAEALVAFTLAGLGDDWHLFNGVAMKGGGDIDHVLVGPAGVFAVSTKSERGTYAIGGDGRLTLNGQPCNHAADAQARALKLRNWLEAMLQADPAVKSIPFVRPVLVNPFAFMAFPARRENAHVWVMDPRQLADHAANDRRLLRMADVAGCVAVLKRLTGWEAVPPNAAKASTARQQ